MVEKESEYVTLFHLLCYPKNGEKYFWIILSNLNLTITFLMPSLPMNCPHSESIFIAGSILIVIMLLITKKALISFEKRLSFMLSILYHFAGHTHFFHPQEVSQVHQD